MVFGVNSNNIEFVSIDSGIFGTLTEAKGIANIAADRGTDLISIVSSPHHTRRAWLAFSAFLNKKEVTLHTYASNYQVGLRALLVEYLKLIFYRIIIVPIYTAIN